jgi:hypothetical protein
VQTEKRKIQARGVFSLTFQKLQKVCSFADVPQNEYASLPLEGKNLNN